MSERTRPSGYFVAITPHASTNVAEVNSDWPRAIYVGVAGNIAVVRHDDTVVSFVGAAAGSVIPITYKRINATGTTATDLVALY